VTAGMIKATFWMVGLLWSSIVILCRLDSPLFFLSGLDSFPFSALCKNDQRSKLQLLDSCGYMFPNSLAADVSIPSLPRVLFTVSFLFS